MRCVRRYSRSSSVTSGRGAKLWPPQKCLSPAPVRMTQPTSGEVLFKGEDVAKFSRPFASTGKQIEAAVKRVTDIVAEIAEEGKTVLFSSHIVEEVERVADYVGIINDGEILLTSSVDDIKASYKRVRYATNGTRPELAGVPGVLAVENGRHEQILTVHGFGDETLHLLGERGVKNPEVLPISLEDIFVNTVRAERERRANS